MIDPKLYTLLAVVQLNSYTKAAEYLSLSQPAITQHIKQLEKELKIKLFNRVRNEIKPTDAGDLVIHYAKQNIALYERMKQNLLDEKKQIRRLTVGITHTAESNAVAEVLGRYCASNPGTSITIITDTVGNLNNMLRNYEVDLVVAEGKLPSDEFKSLVLDTDSLMLIVSNNNKLAQNEGVTLEQLKHEPLILRRPSSGTRNLFAAHLESQNMSLYDFNVIMEIDNIATIKDLIRSDIGVSILSKSVCLDELRKGKIKVLPIENLTMVREIRILYREDFKHMDILDDIVKEYEYTTQSNHSSDLVS